MGNGNRAMEWLLLQPDVVVFLVLRNLCKTCTVELVQGAPHWEMADDMAGGTTIEAEVIVTSVLALGIS